MAIKKYRYYIIDIKNEQSGYASCLDFITSCKKRDRHGINIALNKLGKVYSGIADTIASPKYIEIPISSDEGKKRFIYNKHMMTKNDIDELMQDKNPIQFHIRIHFKQKSDDSFVKKEELIQLQYLALLLKKVDSLGLLKKQVRKSLSVFMVPLSCENYPFTNEERLIDYNTYSVVSQYLRLLSKKYTGVIYGLTQSKGDMTVTSIDFRKGKKYESHFPLLIIDEHKYDKLFVETIQESFYKQLWDCKKNRVFGNARDENPDKAMYDFIAETDMNYIRETISSGDKETIENHVLNWIIKDTNSSLMQFSLFAFLVHFDDELTSIDIDMCIKSAWEMAEEICNGIKQIVQNSIQYSPFKQVIFSFYTYMDETDEPYLKIVASDFNENDDMVSTFVKNLTYEEQHINLSGINASNGHRSLLSKKEEIAICNFFSEFYGFVGLEEWKKFREQDLVAHVGLSLFALTAQKCKAIVEVTSSKKSFLDNNKCYFYKDYNSKSSFRYEKKEPINRYVIPGTQFAVTIPIRRWGKPELRSIGRINIPNKVTEDYKTFAKYLDYREKMDPIKQQKKISMKSGEILDSKKKFRLVQQWRNRWKEIFAKAYRISDDGNGKVVVNSSFEFFGENDYFTNSDNVEVCLKGFIGALETISAYDRNIYFALTELQKGFIEQFRKISVLMGNKIFPSNLQLFICEKNYENRVVLLGDSYIDAIYNSYMLSLEQGVNGFKKEEYYQARDLKALLAVTNEKVDTVRVEPIQVFPFDAVLHIQENEYQTIFEKHIKAIAEHSLSKDKGYKIEDTHMRLGSKVHIESFYEMSFLFYRTPIANKIAFILLRQLMNIDSSKRIELDFNRDKIIFYGYASYSKAILLSITEMLNVYKNSEHRVGIATYQHNLQTESSRIDIDFALPNEFFNKTEHGEQDIIKIVQIVPISSTLTTFDKMWEEFSAKSLARLSSQIKISANYTIFWVISQDGNLMEGLPSKIESSYWEKAENGIITTKFNSLEKAGNKYIHYSVSAPVKWHAPLACTLCYPKFVIDEIPLVETDPTSTVPDQQISFRERNETNPLLEGDIIKKNNERLIDLYSCIIYGHIFRRQNHYQYYIDTQKYFHKVKEKVMRWLKKELSHDSISSFEPTLNIIFSPEHNSNIGFAQYVNAYYFGGMAELVSLNIDKEFRSNFRCEHAALIETIEKLFENLSEKDYIPVRFYFADDTIITGETLKRANSLLQSLIPSKYVNCYQTNIFSKIFVLVDRLSHETKQSYIHEANKNFHSFLHISISNMRTQGDSCIGCKLKKSAEYMYKRNPLPGYSRVLREKMEKYAPRKYDEIDTINGSEDEKSFQRLILTHIVQNLIIGNRRNFVAGDAYDILIDIANYLLGGEKTGTLLVYQELLDAVSGIEGVGSFFKVICRPFLSFDFKIKWQVNVLLIFLAELFWEHNAENVLPKDKGDNSNFLKNCTFLYKKERVCRTKALYNRICGQFDGRDQIKCIEFFVKIVLEGLADLGSTYLMRKQTLIAAYNSICKNESVDKKSNKKFWEEYAINIYRLISNNKDETKEVWLEYLYLTGKEYNEECNSEETIKSFEPKFLYETITGEELCEKGNEKEEAFYLFCYNLFLQNTGVNFDGIEKYYFSQKENFGLKSECNNNTSSHNFGDKYFMEYWRMFRALSRFQIPSKTQTVDENKLTKEDREIVIKEYQLFERLCHEKTNPGIEREGKVGWYDGLLTSIAEVISGKYGIDKNGLNIALLTEKKEIKKGLQQLNFVSSKLNYSSYTLSETKYKIKKRIYEALNSPSVFDINSYGYMTSDFEAERKRPYLIVFFNDFDPGKWKNSKIGLAKVFLYVSIDGNCEAFVSKKNFYLKFALREILTYRNRIQRFLERDFTGDIFSNYAHTVGENSILSHEKANSHNTTGDDKTVAELFMKDEDAYKSIIDSGFTKTIANQWLIMREYTNRQIAKLFVRSFHDSSNEGPPLYILEQDIVDKTGIYKRPLKYFSEINPKENDADERFQLLRQIILFDVGENLRDANFISNQDGQYLNLEYFKCIIVDVCHSAIKYKSDKPEFLLRVKRYKEIAKKLESGMNSNGEISPRLKGIFERQQCKVKLFREKGCNENVDFLVIQNSVDKIFHGLKDWEKRNEVIAHRIKDPLDYIDGHMSLFTINRYIENFNGIACKFEYSLENGELFFYTKLPVLKGSVK